MNPSSKPTLLKLILLFLVLLLGSLACTSEVSIFPTPTIPTLAPWTPPPTEAPPQAEPAQPTETPIPTEAGPEVLFYDDFSNPESGWDRVTDETISTDYSDEAYRIMVSSDLLTVWANPGQDYGDVIVEVFATPNSEEEDFQYGVICRHMDIDHWYALVISADGYAAIRKKNIVDDEVERTYLAEWTEAPAVIRGNETNLLRAECTGERLSLYVNGTLTVEATDPDYTSGDVGLTTGTFTATYAEVFFDDFVVTQP